jgi:fibronectin-binding autotransporter adhesin
MNTHQKELSLPSLRARALVNVVTSFFIAAALAILAVAPHPANAQNLLWAPHLEPPPNTGGTGTWNTTQDQGWNGTLLTPWDNTAGTSATFGSSVDTFGPGPVTLNGEIKVQNLTFAITGYTIEGGPLTFFGASGARSTISANAGVTGTIDSVLEGVAGLEKAGLGTVILNGSNTYTGGTILTAGTLSISSDTNLGAAAGGLTFNGGTLLTAAEVIDSRSISLPGHGVIDNGGGTHTDTFSAAISGVGSLTFTGTGTTILTSANTYTGGKTISNGTLQLGNGITTGSVAGNIVDNAALVFNPSGAQSFGGVISGTGSLTQKGPGTLTLTGTNNQF